MARTSRLNPSGDERVAMLVALPMRVWMRIRAEAADLGIGPSRLIEPVLLQAFGPAAPDGDVSTEGPRP
jgi:hypothetical protein